MDEFSYLSVLLSLILGLAVTQILTGFRGLLLSRGRVKLYWPVIAWAALLLLICFQSWWAMFGMRARQHWSFAQFGMVLLQTVVTYMVAGLVFPDFVDREIIDLRQNFYAHRGWFFSLGFTVLVVSVCKDVVLDGVWPHPLNLGFHALFGAAMLIGAFTAREWYHKCLIVFGGAIFVLYIGLLFARLQ